MWREAMMELLDQLEAENPEDPALAPKELSEWACIYIKYLQIFHKLEAAYDQMLQPQKRQDMQKALEACMGRMLEIRHWLVKLNRGLDFVQLDDLLVDLKLTPDVLEVPVPRYFIEDRAKELNDRDKFLQVLLEKYQQANQQGAADAGAVVTGNSSKQGNSANAVSSGPPLLPEEAVAVIIRNERGRQARERTRLVASAKRSRTVEERRRQAGVALSKDEAVTKIQSMLRGCLWRNRVRQEANQELVFVGMKPQPVDPKADPQAIEARHLLARKQQLLDPEHGTLRKYDDAVVSLKAKVLETEGEDMREAIQDKINAWFIANRNPQTGEYPDLPPEEAGGSKVILQPPLPSVEELLADEAAAAADKSKKGGKPGAAAAKKPAGKDAKGGGKGDAAAEGSGTAEVISSAFIPLIQGDAAAEGSGTAEVISSAFIPLIEGAVAEYIGKWQERPAPGGASWEQQHDPELLKDELRPLVFEEVRQQVDEEMRTLLANLKELVAAEAAAKAGKKAKKKKGGKAKKGAGGKKAKGGKGKKKNDPTAERSMESLFAELASNGVHMRLHVSIPSSLQADRSMESLFAELASNGVLVSPPKVELADYLGGYSFMGATLEKAGIIPDPSLAQIRQAVTEFAILPLGSQLVHERLPHIKSLLLYGAPSTGKTMVAQAIAHLSGSCFFDLSPRNTDGHYPGKAVAMLLHMVFKVAKTMAPSVIYIDEVEKVFVSDKKKAKEFGGQEPFSHIKKELLRELKGLAPGDRVLMVGASREPWLAAKKDEKAFMGVWGKALHMPLPDYAARRLIWPGLFARHGGKLAYDFDLSTLAQLSEGYAAGALDAVVSGLLTPVRRERLKMHPVDIQEILHWLCRVQAVPQEVDEALHKWADRTPALAAIKGAAADKAAAAAGGGSSKKGAKDEKGKKKKK
ncbi:hypothetical protein OEZ86_008306 [Tetradesmus obliquus]|nr:hypothetical protein OEZ86_008306 [Tetradesmus obliquus]